MYSWVVVVPIGGIHRRLSSCPGLRWRRRSRGEVPEPHVGSGHRRAFADSGVAPDMERAKGLDLRRRWGWGRMSRRESDRRSQPRVDIWPLRPGAGAAASAGVDLPPLAPARCLRLSRQQMLPVRSVFLHPSISRMISLLIKMATGVCFALMKSTNFHFEID